MANQYPGHCGPETRFGSGTLTTWSFEPGDTFGGMNGARMKRIDAIVSTHGFPLHAPPGARFGLERFYFTDLYGLTRWEAWKPAADVPNPSTTCRGPTEMLYRGVAFRLKQCRDWSAVEVFDHPKPRWPWPYPEANVLSDCHFEEPDLRAWKRRPSEAGVLLDAHQLELRTASTRGFPRISGACVTSRLIAAGGNAIPARRCFRTWPSIG